MPEPKQPRKITDAGALRALAHPLRLRLMEELLTAGSATATELAEMVGESCRPTARGICGCWRNTDTSKRPARRTGVSDRGVW